MVRNAIARFLPTETSNSIVLNFMVQINAQPTTKHRRTHILNPRFLTSDKIPSCLLHKLGEDAAHLLQRWCWKRSDRFCGGSRGRWNARRQINECNRQINFVDEINESQNTSIIPEEINECIRRVLGQTFRRNLFFQR